MGLWYSLWRHTPDLVALGVVLCLQFQLYRWLRAWGPFGRSERAARTLFWVHILLGLWMVCGLVSGFSMMVRLLPQSWYWTWFRGMALAWGIAVGGMFAAALLARCIPDFRPDRRRFLRVAQSAILAAPVAVTGFGVIMNRRHFEFCEVQVDVPGLPPDLDGLRLVQLSDIHLSPFLTENEFAPAIDMANEAKAHVALVTGDLISSRGDPLEACLNQLARLKADAGVFACMGNHEAYSDILEMTERGGARRGIRFLRGTAAPLRFGGARLNLAGVDYQPFRRPYLVGAEHLVAPDSFNVLLSHNPDVLPVAARQGYDLVMSGHTHGGQVTVEILDQYVNLARFFTPYVRGLYRQDRTALYVTRGIGTVGVPARIGATPEVSIIQLCRT